MDKQKLEKALHLIMLRLGVTWCPYCKNYFATQEFADNKHGHEKPND